MYTIVSPLFVISVMKVILPLACVLILCFSACHRKTGSGARSRSGTETGYASYYADKYDGKKTSSGEIFRQRKMTAAHRTLRFGTSVRVTNIENGKSVKVRVNDRGPFVAGRVIDLSKSAAKRIDLHRAGVAKVRIKY